MARKKSEIVKKAEEKAETAAVQEAAKGDDAAAGGEASCLEDLKAALAKGNVAFGSRSVVKAIKMKNPKAVLVASNCPESVKSDIGSYAKVSGTKIEDFAGTAKQLGVFCGKPFAVASLAVLEEKKK